MQNDTDASITKRHFDNAAFREYTNVTVTSQNNATVRVLCDDLHAKSRIHVLTACELPC